MNTTNVKTNWNQVYILTKHWKSDLEFYDMDIQFLKRLIGKYFIWLDSDENIANLMKINLRLNLQLNEIEALQEEIGRHLAHLAERMDNPKEQQGLRIENDLLEMRLANFIMAFKALKKEVMQTTEYVIEEEKLERFVAN